MNPLAAATVKGLAIALAVAVLLLLASNGTWFVHAAALESARDSARADLGNRTAERDSWKVRVDELSAANKAYGVAYGTLARELQAAQLENTRLQREGGEAIALAEAAARDADRTLKTFVGRYAEQLRHPDCASALANLQRFCPALEGY